MQRGPVDQQRGRRIGSVGERGALGPEPAVAEPGLPTLRERIAISNAARTLSKSARHRDRTSDIDITGTPATPAASTSGL